MSQERYLELKNKIQSLGAGGFKKLSEEEQEEYKPLKAKYAGIETPTEPKTDTITVPKELLEELSAQIAELRANQSMLVSTTPKEVMPGQAVAVSSVGKVYKKAFKRFRETSEQPWEYVADVKHLKFYFDREIEQKVNIFKITTITADGNMQTHEVKDTDFARMGEAVLLKITDKKSQDFEVQDKHTPLITTGVRYSDSSNPKSVTGVDVTPIGPVKNMIRYQETSFTVHIPADKDESGQEVFDTVNSPAKVTFRIIENQNARGGVHLDPNSITIK